MVIVCKQSRTTSKLKKIPLKRNGQIKRQLLFCGVVLLQDTSDGYQLVINTALSGGPLSFQYVISLVTHSVPEPLYLS